MDPVDKQLAEIGLFPYQRRWLRDGARFKLGLWARQTGKDFTCAAEAVIHSLQHPRSLWLIVATGERQALETLAKARDWAAVCRIAVENYREFRPAPGALMRSAEIEWANGSRIIALPARPETIRGYSANIILTEFAFHERDEEIWRAIYPTITNPLRGGGKLLRIITTPNGRANRFHDLWTAAEGYSRHQVTIHDAARQGLPIDVEALRRGLNDPEGWAQEYECEFIDGSTVLLPYELIEPAESEEASQEMPRQELLSLPGALYAGVDFGRSRDLTVCWILERQGDLLWTRAVRVLENVSTPGQCEILKPLLKGVRRVSVDSTGPGIGLGDLLVQAFGQWREEGPCTGRVELCTFTPAFKSALFARLRVCFERGHLRIPRDPEIREDLHDIERLITRNGQAHYRARRSAKGHGDRATALALALRAAGESGPASLPALIRPPAGLARQLVSNSRFRL